MRVLEHVATVPVVLPVGWQYPRHRHPDEWQMLVLRAGAMRVEVGGTEYHATAGEVLVYPAGVDHAEWQTGSIPVEAFYIGFRASGGSVPVPVHSPDRSAHVAHLAGWMAERAASGVQKEAAFLNRQLALLLEELASPTDRGTLEDRVRGHVNRHLAEPLPLEALARVAGLSKFRFAHVFRAETGRTPGQFVRDLRLEAARTLISATQLPLKAVAEQTGFCDEFHLSKAFRRAFGQSPRAWRLQAQGRRAPLRESEPWG